MKWFLENGADPNLKSGRGFTPLEHAAIQGSLEVVKLLVGHGADVRYTPALHRAAADSVKFDGIKHPGRLEIMDFLLDRGANIDLLEPEFIDKSGRPRQVTGFTGTPLHHAVQSEDPEHVRFLLRRGADRHIKGVMGFTPLEVAEGHHMHEIVDILRNE